MHTANRNYRTLVLRTAALGILSAASGFIPALLAQESTLAPVPAPTPALTSAQGDSVLGQIGDIQITVKEIQDVLTGLGMTPGTVSSADSTALNQMVRNLLVQRLIVREAQDEGFDQLPDITAQIEQLKQTALAEAYLQKKAAPPETFPSESELKLAYENNKAALLVPRSYRLAQIFIAAPADADEETAKSAKAKLEVVSKALAETGADFAALASAHSEETQSAGRGGEIGWLAENQIQPEIRKELPGMKLNAVSEPLKMSDGWHFIKVLDIREPFTPTLEQVRVQLKQRMRAEQARANGEALVAQLLQENPVAINELTLNQVLAPATP